MHAAVLDDMAALAADFPAWHIWRSRGSSGTETGWNATRKGRRRGAVPGTLPRLTAASPASLRALLGQQEALRQDPAA
jgi:hypothetical protein